MTGISYAGGGSLSYGYDDDSRLTSATNLNGTVAMAYNSRSMVESVTDVFGQTISYLYDENGNRQSASYGGSTLSYQYDVINRVKQITHNTVGTTTYDYDLASATDPQGRVHKRTLPNGVVVTAELDRLDRLKKLTHVKGTTWSGDYRYAYNAVDQITQMEEYSHPGAGDELSAVHSYAYDQLQRLTSEAHTNQPSKGYAYDSVGNRTNSPTGATPTYSNNNRLMSYGGLTFTYDANGNRTAQAAGQNVTQYWYDNENRLTSVMLSNADMVHYKYDALGRRIERSKNGGTSWERFSYDGADVVKDTRSDGVTIEYGNGLEIDDKLWQKIGTGSTKYFTVDHLGSTRALTDANGASLDSFSTDAFGDGWIIIVNSNGDTITRTRYQYTGREIDVETGLMYYRARFYDPAIGRFVSEDPIGLAGGINLYGYVGNDPVNFVDPDGLQKKGKRPSSSNVHVSPPRPDCPTTAVTVNIWYPKDGKYGHASLTLGDGTNLGWWPAEDWWFGLYGALWGVKGVTKEYKEEIFEEGRTPDYVVRFYGVDQEKIKAAYNKATQDGWSVGQRSCTNVTLRALNAGLGDEARLFEEFINRNVITSPEKFHFIILSMKRIFEEKRR
jgi:RHS repeat-associated protein